MKFKTYNAVAFIRKDDSCNLTLLNCFTIFKLTGFVADIHVARRTREQRLKDTGNIFNREKEKTLNKLKNISQSFSLIP